MDVVNGSLFGGISRILGVITCTVVLVACGGGGGGGGGGNPPPATTNKPTVNAGADITVDMGQRVDLDPKALVANNISASLSAQGLEIKGSSENKEHIVQLVWAKIEGPDIQISSSGFNDGKIYFTAPSTNGAASIKITFKLTLTNAGGLSGEDTVTITVNRVNKAPIANAGDDIDSLSGETVKLNASLSNDADGSIAKYLWEQISGETVVLDDTQAAQPSFVAPQVNEATTFEFKLTVEDNEGKKSGDAVQVVVKPGDAPNLAMHFPPAAGIYTESTLSLFGVVAAKGDAGITSLTVDVGNGPAAVEVSENGEWRIDSVSLPVGVAQIAIAVEATDSEGRRAVVRSKLLTSKSNAVGEGQNWLNTIIGVDVDSSTNKLWMVTHSDNEMRLTYIDLKNGNRSATVSDFNNTAQGVSTLAPVKMIFDDVNKQAYLTSAPKNDPAQVLRIDAMTGNRSVLSDITHGTGQGLELPSGITMGEPGKLLVADNHADSILSIDLTTGDRTVIADAATLDYGVDAPVFVTTGNDKSRFFANLNYTTPVILEFNNTNDDISSDLVLNGQGIKGEIDEMVADTTSNTIYFMTFFEGLVGLDLSTGETRKLQSPIDTPDSFTVDESRGLLYVVDGFPASLMVIDPLSGNKIILSKSSTF